MTLGTLLIKWRQQQKKGQKAAAASFNIAQSTYYEWEADMRLPKTKYIVPLAHALGVKTEVILQCIHGENLVQEEEIQRLKAENEYLRQREMELQQLVELLAKKVV
jgi:transcriptional regulator with XRE-family HTH domain